MKLVKVCLAATESTCRLCPPKSYFGSSPAVQESILIAPWGIVGTHLSFSTRVIQTGKCLVLIVIHRLLKWLGSRLQPFGDRAVIVKGHFMELKRLLSEQRISQVEGVLFDLGVSSPQLDDPARGFSFQSEGPLDMRMDRVSGPTAADIVNGLDEVGLADMIYRWGDERYSRRIARALVRARQQRAISTTRQLASVIESAVPGHYRRGRIHCATRTFQALRIAVNKELDHLEASLRDAVDVLAPGGRLCVISFHSLEDRIVKQSFKAFSILALGELEVLTKRPQVPTEDEIRRNPRSRSAKLRVLQRIMKEGHA